ncbi:MAG: DUF484 family protein [Acidiferrobacterales bacterium]
MNNKPSSGEQNKELSWEDAVARYLEGNPDYFLRYPGLLEALSVPHPGAGAAVSLIERQVQVLRDRNQELSRQLRELLSIARENDVLADRLHRFALAMIDSNSLDDALATARDMLRQLFKLDAVVILLRAGKERLAGRPEFVDAFDQRFDQLLRQLSSSGESAPASGIPKPLCGAMHGADAMSYLFAGDAQTIRSTAMVLLSGTELRGIMCLGSTDPLRFHPQMGTVYLARLGEILTSRLGRLL